MSRFLDCLNVQRTLKFTTADRREHGHETQGRKIAGHQNTRQVNEEHENCNSVSYL